MESSTMTTTCTFCNDNLNDGQPTTSLYAKGSDRVNEISTQRNDSISTIPGQIVHKECRRRYCHPSYVAQPASIGLEEKQGSTLRSAETHFLFSTDCLYCGTTVTDQYEWYYVRTTECNEKLLKHCSDRDDDWAETVQARILHVHDLPAADAIYHQQCSVNFRTGKCMPSVFALKDHLHKQKLAADTSTEQKAGRPQKKKSQAGRQSTDRKNEAFVKVVEFFQENDDEQTTISDLVSKMDEYLEGCDEEAYSEKHMRRKLIEHFGSSIIITTINCKTNVVTMRHTAESILVNFAKGHCDNPKSEKSRVIEVAAKLILEDIKAADTSNDHYPGTSAYDSEEAALTYLPDSLRLLLECIIKPRDIGVKIASIGQALMQAARPRVLLAPLQVGLAVQLHHHFSSRFLIDSLHKHGFCSSYREVARFEQNAAVNQGTDIPGYDSENVQYVGDNVDHNIATLDGNDTFHGMGIIAIVTPGTKHNQKVPRSQIASKDVSNSGFIKIQYYRGDNKAINALKYGIIPVMVAEDPTSNLDVLWQTSLLLSPTAAGWNGMMQYVHYKSHPGKSSVLFLPMIDMRSSDLSCIFSTLNYIAQHASRYGITPIITFDQPLWWKALTIILAEPDGSPIRKIVLRMGIFHMEMSFLGSIGHLMSGSGLAELLELIYAPHTVPHILSGKAVSRAVRAHLLMDAVLNCLLLSKPLHAVPRYSDGPQIDALQNPEPTELPLPDEAMHPVIVAAQHIYDELMTKRSSAEQINSEEALQNLADILKSERESLHENRTAKLWLLYLDMIRILRKLIKAERLGLWSLHLEAVGDMLPYLAASGHTLYAKSARVYLQSMIELENSHPDVYENFQAGFHVARRSDRTWAGLSSDLIIEQVLMRSLKTSGGLTRGRGMTELQRTIWLLSMPACAEVNQAMQELTGVKYTTSEQHKEMSKSRQLRDNKDTHTLWMSLKDRSPFDENTTLQNIMTGVHADVNVNVDNAKEIGGKIMDSMTDQLVTKYIFKRKAQAVTLASKSSIKIGDEQVQVDPQLLFQRLIVATQSSTENPEDVFSYELSSHPPSLFDNAHMMREAQKSVLADAIWSKVPDSPSPELAVSDTTYILDGGSLLHRIPWPRGFPSYRELCQLYCDYVGKKYGQPHVVFDGYEESTTKFMTHQRRACGKVGAEVSFSDEMKITQKKDEFLSNSVNKQRFINMLSTYLQLLGCKVHHARGDADLLIVTTAIQCSASNTTVVVGEDTDLLVLLCFYVDPEVHDIFMYSQSRSSTNQTRMWNIQTIHSHLGADVCAALLFIHAVGGCDTTSRLYGIGKGSVLKKFHSSKALQNSSKVFSSADTTVEQLVQAGERALVVLYGGKLGDNLNGLRYKKFCERTATKKTYLQSQTLPPTAASAKYHSMRVYLQIQQWRGVENLRPEDWGWKQVEGHLYPMMTDQPAAPERLLHVIRCGCISDCSTLRCVCRKNQLECSTACSQCRGTACSNSTPVEPDTDEDNELAE